MTWAAPSLSPVPRSVTGDIKAWAQQVAYLLNQLATIANAQAINFSPIMDAVVGSAAGGLAYRGKTAWTTFGSFAPGGRLSLSPGVAVQTADVVGGATIYYLPYIHPFLPVVGLTLPAAGVSLALDSNSLHTGYQQSGKNFDLFLYNNAGTLVLATGPAWTSDTARANAIDQTTVPGIWTNTASITLKFDATASTLTATAGTALFVGSMRASANGQCTAQFKPAAAAGGSNTFIGLYNAYNKLPRSVFSRDNTSSWTYATATWRQANNSASNRVSYLDGLGDIAPDFIYAADGVPATTGVGGVGANFNAISGAPNLAAPTGNSAQITLGIKDIAAPVLGFNFVQAMEYAAGGVNTTFFGTSFSSVTVGLTVGLQF